MQAPHEIAAGSVSPATVRERIDALFDRVLLIFLLALSVAYSVAYLRAPALPGNGGSLTGWWSWWDQGHYLQSAKAIAGGDFSPANHLYPPLYPLLGALFVAHWPQHPFFVVDLLSLLAVAFGFVAAASRLVWWPVAMVLFLTTVFADHVIFNQYVFPWNSTPVAAIFSLLTVLLASDKVRGSRRFAYAATFGFGLGEGLVAALRPIDAVVFLPLLLAQGWLVFESSAPKPLRTRLQNLAVHCGIVAWGLLPGLGLFFGFNRIVSHSWLGTYLLFNASAHGFSFSRLAEKTVSLLFDPAAIYLAPGTAVLDHYPWMLASAAGAGLAVLRGPLLLRAVVAAIAVAALLYFPYNDLLPNGVWRDLNIHYFKWMQPWLGLSAIWPFVAVARALRAPNGDAGRLAFLCCGLFGLAALLSLVRITIRPDPASVRIGTNRQVIVDTSPDGHGASMVDAVDIAGVAGNADALYRGTHALRIGDRAYRSYTDFRIVPAPWGARIIFLHTLPGGVATIRLDPRAAFQPGHARGRTYRIGYRLGRPCWLMGCARNQMVPPISVANGSALAAR